MSLSHLANSICYVLCCLLEFIKVISEFYIILHWQFKHLFRNLYIIFHVDTFKCNVIYKIYHTHNAIINYRDSLKLMEKEENTQKHKNILTITQPLQFITSGFKKRMISCPWILHLTLRLVLVMYLKKSVLE